jgi:hypothetical protein
MSIETILIVLLIIWFLGGGFYGRGRWYGQPAGYTGGFDPMMILWIIVIVVIVGWLLGGGSLFYRH